MSAIAVSTMKHRAGQCLGGLRRGVPALGVWLAAAGVAWGEPVAGASADKSYVMTYPLIALIIALGLILVLRPSQRAVVARVQEDI